MCNSELKSSFRLSLSFTKCPSPPSCSLSPFVSGVELSFKTRAPDGLLLCSFSPGNQEEFLAVQIKNGRPYFLFDPQVGNVFQKRLCIIENLNYAVLQHTFCLLLYLSVFTDCAFLSNTWFFFPFNSTPYTYSLFSPVFFFPSVLLSLQVSSIFSLTFSHLINVICSPSLVSVREAGKGEKLWKCVNVWIGLQLTHSLQSPRANTNCKLIKLCTHARTHTHTHTHAHSHTAWLSLSIHTDACRRVKESTTSMMKVMMGDDYTYFHQATN